MSRKLTLILFVFLINNIKLEEICESITQEVSFGGENRNIIWDVYLKDNIYRSTPLCLDENSKIIERFCFNNSWDDEPSCEILQEEINPCPEDFFYFKSKNICYTILKNVTFPPKCPYSNVIGFFDHIQLFSENLVEGPVWFPAKTIQDYGVGNMVIIEPTKYYGDLVSNSSFWKETFNKRCLIYESKLIFKPVFCNATYDFVCAYKPLEMNENSPCSRKLQKLCASADFNFTEGKCFCKQENDCNEIAEFKKPYQHILSENCKDPSCSICQENIVYDKPSISMKLNKESKRLELFVDNIDDLYLPDGRKVPIFCFSNTNSYISTFSIDSFDDYEVINENRIVYYFKYSQNCPGHYWCEAFELPTMAKLQTGKVLVFDEEFYGNEYAAILSINFRNVKDALIDFLQGTLIRHLTTKTEPFYLRWITTVDIDEESMIAEFLIHVTSKVFKDIQIEYSEFYDILNLILEEVKDFMTLNDLRSVSYCLPDVTNSMDIYLHWPLTKVNATTTPEEFCLQEDGTPVFRACVGDFLYGAKWMSVNGSCSKDPIKSPITAVLYDLLHKNETIENKINNLEEITGNFSNYLPVDIHYIAEIIEKTDKDHVDYLLSFTKVIDNIVSTQKETLQTSQDLLNSTDKLLYNFDVLVENFYNKKRIKFDTDIMTKNIKVYIFDAKISDTIGIAIYQNDFGYEIKKLSRNVTLETLLEDETVQIATFIPKELIKQISENLFKNEPLIVAITVFLNDYLFNQDHLDTKQVSGNIFGILLPKLKEDFTVQIPIVYKNVDNAIEKQCSYWHYGSPNEFANIKGKWEADKTPKTFQNHDVCWFDHTTHFALLIFSDFTVECEQELSSNYKYLNVVTTLGCALSIIGILGILITAVLFKPWRSSKGNQILVQYSIVTLLQICLLYAASNIDSKENYVLCVIIGASLHYNVLSQFCWMLVMAILHYQRFVLVFNQQNKWIILKSCLIGYIFPFLPVIINISINIENYTVGTTGICYPTGAALYIWLLTPVGCIVLTNLFIFCIIIKNIFHHKFNDECRHDYIFVLKLRLVVVLFSTLGITWLFGFAAEMFTSIWCTYIFCVTASLQGFIIFLAFIVFNATTRRMYWLFTKTFQLRLKLLCK
ncbi:adhesion G-protein coupled receptor G4-like [Onthophagus taurus]|uniref:adhesion G-protein coupled receptor G4-like n=1 Tax=Onthophagus taurus TaxID=166361 RepID=UPI0039BE5746